MMEIQYLTPEDQLLLDPYGYNRSAIKAIPFDTDYFEEPSAFYRISPQEAFDRLMRIRKQTNSDRHRPYQEYMDEMDSKCGPQGGRFAWTKVQQMLEPYYERANASRSISRVLLAGRDFLIRRIRQIIQDYGYPQIMPVPVYRTNAALPTGMHKGDYLAEVTGMSPYRHMYPTVPGQRRMRNKDRLIFQDSVNNVRYIEKELTAVRLWLRKYLPEYFSGWLNPQIYTNVMLTSALQHNDWFIETDYKSMDTYFSWQLVAELILPLYEVLVPDSFLSFAAAIEELFHQSVYMGDYLIVGLHNLFSGQGITNDFETEYSVMLAIGTALELHCYDQMRLAALGDDITLALRTKARALPEKFKSLMIETSNLANMLIHDDEKSRIVRGETRFCRRVYYLAGGKTPDGILLGNYPLNLALNNIIQPERPQKKPGLAAQADLQRMDNCYGSPGWIEMVQMLRKYSTHRFSEVTIPDDSSDWWYRVYGEKWSPTVSPSFELIHRT